MSLAWELSEEEWLALSDEERKNCRQESIMALEHAYFQKCNEMLKAVTANRIGTANAAQLAQGACKLFEIITGEKGNQVQPVQLKILGDLEEGDGVG